MPEPIPSLPLLSAFIAASLLLAIVPGPGVIYIVARSLSQGRQAGFASVAGVALGNFINAVAAAIGLGAVLAVSSTAFLAVKYAGAAYLVYLGIQSLRAARSPAAPVSPRAGATGKILRDGFLVALLNPKTALFFASFLPQFMSVDAAPILQSVLLGGLFVMIAIVTDTIYVLTAGTIAPLLSRAPQSQRFGHYVSGGTYIGLGLFAALSGTRATGKP